MHISTKLHLKKQTFSKFICPLNPSGHTLKKNSVKKCRGRDLPTSHLRRSKGITESGMGTETGMKKSQDWPGIILERVEDSIWENEDQITKELGSLNGQIVWGS